ncbi:histamine H3 receptor-like [Haliotis rufescens]|uniref:histamine H3 receptor-like n=1 Tax=Haliotis rufescens TaxID=6454 RepID=UPI00201EE6F7|nr:histamine H3 receptor-like [Haliotis rufescens]
MSNITDSTGPFLLGTPAAITIATFTSIMGVLTTAENLMVFLAFATNSSLRKFSDYFILNLAVADFLIGCVCIPPYIPYLLTGVWEPGRAFCKIWLLFDYICPAASTINICIISIDRYLQVAFPFKYRARQTTTMRMVMMLIPWIIAGLTYLPSILFWELWTGLDTIPHKVCFVPYYYTFEYAIFASMVEFVMPFTVVGAFNILIFILIRKRSRGILGQSKVEPMKQVQGEATKNTQTSGPAKPSLAKDKKAARSLFILVLVFGICWMPYEVCALISSVCADCINPVFFEFTFWMLWVNSTINPILYPLLHKRFRDAFFKLIGLQARNSARVATVATVQ